MTSNFFDVLDAVVSCSIVSMRTFVREDYCNWLHRLCPKFALLNDFQALSFGRIGKTETTYGKSPLDGLSSTGSYIKWILIDLNLVAVCSFLIVTIAMEINNTS